MERSKELAGGFRPRSRRHPRLRRHAAIDRQRFPGRYRFRGHPVLIAERRESAQLDVSGNEVALGGADAILTNPSPADELWSPSEWPIKPVHVTLVFNGLWASVAPSTPPGTRLLWTPRARCRFRVASRDQAAWWCRTASSSCTETTATRDRPLSNPITWLRVHRPPLGTRHPWKWTPGPAFMMTHRCWPPRWTWTLDRSSSGIRRRSFPVPS